MIRRPPRSTLDRSSAASDVYKRQHHVRPSVVKDIVRQLYANLLKFASNRGSANNAMFRDLFPPMGILTDERVAELEKQIGVDIHLASLYEQALTHRSYLQVVNTPDHRSNERLEFLGDAILGMVTAEYLFYNNREVLEGELTKMRSWIVNKKSLAICARALKLDEFLFLSYSATQSLQRGNDSMLADALESIIAAVYLLSLIHISEPTRPY